MHNTMQDGCVSCEVANVFNKVNTFEGMLKISQPEEKTKTR